MNENSNWKRNTLILGGVAGLLIGLAAAFLYIKNQPTDMDPQKLSSKDGMRLGFGVVSFIKQIADLGQ
jgi:hypothetical protein